MVLKERRPWEAGGGGGGGGGGDPLNCGNWLQPFSANIEHLQE